MKFQVLIHDYTSYESESPLPFLLHSQVLSVADIFHFPSSTCGQVYADLKGGMNSRVAIPPLPLSPEKVYKIICKRN